MGIPHKLVEEWEHEL